MGSGTNRHLAVGRIKDLTGAIASAPSDGKAPDAHVKLANPREQYGHEI